MSDLKSQLIKMGASLLRYRPSTLRQDFPRVPAYYRKSVDDYHERGRQAAILMRKAHDKITALEAEKAEFEKCAEHDIRRYMDINKGLLNDMPCPACGLRESLKQEQLGAVMSNKPTTTELGKFLRSKNWCADHHHLWLSEAADRLEAAETEKLRDRILSAVLWVFWSGVMLLTGFLLAMSLV